MGCNKKIDLGKDGLIVLAGGVVFLSMLLIGITKQLEKYFFEAAEVINKIEHIFRAYDSGFYVNDSVPWKNKMLLPEAWKHFGKENWSEPIFVFAQWFTALLLIFGMVAIYFSYESIMK